MKGVSTVSPGPAPTLEPATEGSADELRDTLVPAQEDELPQGVQDLLATLIARHRPVMEAGRKGAGHSMISAQGGPELMSHPQPVRFSGQPVQPSLKQRMEVVAPAFDRVAMPAQGIPGRIDVNPHSSSTAESLPVERTATASTPATLAADAPPPEALMNFHTVRHAPAAAAVSIPLPPMPMPKPALDMMIETLPGSSRGLLQVPFNKGAASGQVTISRLPDEPTQNLLLSPSNTLVFEQLKAPFELARDPGWRLTDDGGEQQHQGSHHSPDEEQTEQQEFPA
ncbi:SpaN/EivJ family type III secretion system needle length determinant [Pseudomonas migulae]